MTNEQFLQQFGQFIDAPNGIKKLRELVLQLAVQGKLVAHNSDELSVTRLFEALKIRQEQFIEEGLIKKEKPLPPISTDEVELLPKGWRAARLAEIAGFNIGRTPPTKESRYWGDEGIPWVAIGDLVDKGHVSKTTKCVTSEAQSKIFKQPPFRAGTILVSFKLTIGKISILDVDAYHNEAIASLIPYTEDMQRFLFILLPQLMQGGDTKNAIKGKTLNSTSLKQLIVPVPPLPEQHRIVAKVDQLMALCDQLETERNAREATHRRLIRAVHHPLTAAGSDSAHNGIDSLPAWHRIRDNFADLYTTLESVQALRQTILQLAVQGRLVEQDKNDEPASVLLEKVILEKGKLISEGEINKQKPLPEMHDEETPFKLPNRWKWVRLGEVVSIRGGKRVSNGYKLLSSPTPHIYIRVSDMKSGTIDDTDLKYIDEEMYSKIGKYIIRINDIYMTIVGATIGKCGLVPHKFDGMNLTENAARITPHIVSKNYIYKVLSSDFCQNQFIDKTKQVGVQKMALNRLASTILPLPPLAEQHRIVAKVNELMALCDQLEASIRDKNDTATRYAEAVVNRIVAA